MGVGSKKNGPGDTNEQSGYGDKKGETRGEGNGPHDAEDAELDTSSPGGDREENQRAEWQ